MIVAIAVIIVGLIVNALFMRKIFSQLRLNEKGKKQSKTRPINFPRVSVTEDKLTEFCADALIAAVDSEMRRRIDHVIEDACGDMFRAQLQKLPECYDSQTLVAKRTGKHDGAWMDVVYVIDDFTFPLSHILFVALCAASKAGYESVSVPALRSQRIDLSEQEKEANVRELMRGVRKFIEENPNTGLKEITFVVEEVEEVSLIQRHVHEAEA